MTMPSEESGKPGLFDRFASWVNRITSKAWFFMASVAMVVLWVPTLFLVRNIDTWQLLINTPTTVLTFLLVAVQMNGGERSNNSIQVKLNALAQGTSQLLRDRGFRRDAKELREAVGLEDKEST